MRKLIMTAGVATGIMFLAAPAADADSADTGLDVTTS